ncbi:MAG: ribonuclease R [Bacillota bacterium]
MNIKNKIMEYIVQNKKTPMFDYKLAESLDVNKGQLDEFRDILDELVDEGKLYKSKKGKYGLPKYFGVKTGKLEIAKRGYGFVITSLKDEEDIFIPKRYINNANHGDTVAVKLVKKKTDTKKKEGKIVKVISKGNKKIVGTFQKSKDFGFVVPDNKKINWDLFIPKFKAKNAKNNDKVVAKVKKWPDGNNNPAGYVLEVLGKSGDPEVQEESIIRSYDIKQDFDKKVLNKANNLNEKISKKEINKRKDFRNLLTVTIDGKDARDFDDAISIKKKNDGYTLWVHIADVSHYVKKNGTIDKEAIERATSIYLPDKVIPMLPENLSNNICSLKPNVDRLTLSVKIELSKKGLVQDQSIHKSIINSDYRMTYENVNRILNKEKADDLEKYKDVKDMFFVMSNLADLLTEKRFDRGSINFDFPETKIAIDDKGYVQDIYKYQRGKSNKIIEEFMLLANETIAEFVYWLEYPFIYRIHEDPEEDRINTFKTFIYNLGYELKGKDNEIHPKEVQDLLEKVKGKEEEYIISKMMLRSLKQAKYSPYNEGHFGLAADHYCHFTSPIRRYPDLEIHRIIKDIIGKNMNDKNLKSLEKRVKKVADISSKQERVAEELERDVIDLKKAEFMKSEIGKEYTGVISSITSFGMFIQLDNTVEGLISMNDLVDDYYIYDEKNLKLIGERNKKEYKLGQKVKIVVDRVSVEKREIDFRLHKSELNL